MKPRGGESKRGPVPAHLVLDTSAYSRFRSGSAQVLEWLAAAKTVTVPTVVLGELEAGFLLGSRAAENRVAIAEFLEEPFVVVADVSADVARHYGSLFALLRRKGTPIGTNDLWIAATTLASAAHLLTYDADFAKIPGLRVTVLKD